MARAHLAKRRKRLAVSPYRWPGLLVGADMIGAYLGGVTRHTITRWHRLYQLPLGHLPDGSLVSSAAAIDQWIGEAIATEMSTSLDRSGWSAYQHGCYSGLRLAFDPDGHRLAQDLAHTKRKA